MKPSSRRISSQRGFTLVEMLITAGVGAVVVGAAALTFVNQVKLERSISRKNQIQTELSVAAMVLDRQLSNAAMNFADTRQGLLVRNNVTSSVPNGGGTTLPVVPLGSASAGILQGTDVVEVRYAEPTTRRAGNVISCANGNCNNFNGTGSVNLSTTEPLTIAEAVPLATGNAESGPVLLFTNGLGVSCLGRATNVNLGITTQFQFRYYNNDLTAFTPTPTNCPGPGMMVYAADIQQRYFAYQVADGASFGLAMQTFNMSTMRWDAPEILVAGIEDLQVAPRVQDASGAMQVCNDGPTPVCTLNATNDFRIRAINVRVTAVGADPLDLGESAARPASFDRTTGTVSVSAGSPLLVMNRAYRAFSEISVFLPNAGLLGL